MPPLSLSALRAQIAAGTLAPIYLLVGDDELEKAAVADELVGAVDEDLQAFNVERLRGSESRPDELIAAANLLPMMVPRRLVVVLEAERLFAPKREGKAAEAEQERLERFLERAPQSATIVFVCGALDLRRRLVKWLFKEAPVVDCGSIESEADAERWVKARAAREKIPLEPDAVRALVTKAANDLVRLRAGLERVALYAMGQATITAADVREAVPQGPESQENFGVANAIGQGDARKALHELGLALDAGMVEFMMLGQLRLAAERLPAPRLPAAMEALLRTDEAIKSSGGNSRALLERLVVELCGAPARGAGPGAWRSRAPTGRR
jgi:DNA polymerase-3 subunit delta